jgi:D-3-phosphoglycerate dehydrogenase
MNTTRQRKVLMAVHHLGDRATPFIRRMEEAGLTVIRNPLGRIYTEAELLAALPGVFATFASVEPYTERVLREARDLQIVARYGVGYDQIDVAAATREGVMVALAIGTNHEAVADSAFTLMAAVVQRTVTHHLRVKAGGWGFEVHPGLWRLTVGIVGHSRCGCWPTTSSRMWLSRGRPGWTWSRWRRSSPSRMWSACTSPTRRRPTTS